MARLRITVALGAHKIVIYSDSQLVVNQVTSSYQVKEERMTAFLSQVHQMLKEFEEYSITQISRLANANADSLARLASAAITSFTRIIPVELLPQPSILVQHHLCPLGTSPSWMDPIISYLRDDKLPDDKLEAKRLRCKSACYTIL